MSSSDSLRCGIWLSCCAKSAGEENRHSDLPETKKRIYVTSETSALLSISHPVVQSSPIQSEQDLPNAGLPSIHSNVISATTADNSSGWDDSHQGTTEAL